MLENGVSKQAVPLQARRSPEGSRKLRFPDFMTTALDENRVLRRIFGPKRGETTEEWRKLYN